MSYKANLSRRKFLSVVPSLAATKLVLPACSQEKCLPLIQTLPSELSPDEKADISRSVMAQELENYFSRDYSCAESILLVCLRYLERPEELVWAAGGFGGGLGQKDLCGFLTGGIMGLGLAAGTLDKQRSESKALCGQVVRSYWSWWDRQAPLRCAAIRPAGSASSICRRLGQLAAARLEQQISALSG